VTDPAFQQVKTNILTGAPLLGSHIVEDVGITAILNAAPNDHHVFCLSKVSQPGGRAAIILLAKLYGTAQSMTLASNVPEPHLPLPVFFLVDFLNHEVKQRSLGEYAEYMVEVGITKAQARYGSSG
jgi:hypothetical protein